MLRPRGRPAPCLRPSLPSSLTTSTGSPRARAGSPSSTCRPGSARRSTATTAPFASSADRVSCRSPVSTMTTSTPHLWAPRRAGASAGSTTTRRSSSRRSAGTRTSTRSGSRWRRAGSSRSVPGSRPTRTAGGPSRTPTTAPSAAMCRRRTPRTSCPSPAGTTRSSSCTRTRPPERDACSPTAAGCSPSTWAWARPTPALPSWRGHGRRAGAAGPSSWSPTASSGSGRPTSGACCPTTGSPSSAPSARS